MFPRSTPPRDKRPEGTNGGFPLRHVLERVVHGLQLSRIDQGVQRHAERHADQKTRGQ